MQFHEFNKDIRSALNVPKPNLILIQRYGGCIGLLPR